MHRSLARARRTDKQFDAEKARAQPRVFFSMRVCSLFRIPAALVAIVALVTALLSGAPTEEQLLRYTMPAEISSPQISPDGAFVAVRARKGDAYGVGIYDLKTGKQRMIGGASDVNSMNFWWKTSRQLIVRTQRADGKGGGYMAVNADGSGAVDLWEMQQTGRLLDPLVTEPDVVAIGTSGVLNRFNLKTGKVEILEESLTTSSDGSSMPRAMRGPP